MATYGPGTKHNALTGGTYVYTKTQCDRELDKKQDKLVAGTGISITDGGTISLSQLPKQEVNVLQTCQNPIKDQPYVLDFDKDHRLYSFIYESAGKTTYKLAGCLSDVDYNTMAEVTLLVTMTNTLGSVDFSADYPIVYVGDTDFRVLVAGSTIWFNIKSFREKIIVSKLGVF